MRLVSSKILQIFTYKSRIIALQYVVLHWLSTNMEIDDLEWLFCIKYCCLDVPLEIEPACSGFQA